MIKKVRPLTEIELQQLRINQAALEKEMTEPLKINPIFFIGFLMFFLFGFAIEKVGIIVIIAFIGVFVVLSIFSYLKVQHRIRNQKKLEIENIKKVLRKSEIEIIEYKCNRAIHFSLDADCFENRFFLELDDGKILSLHTNYWNDLKTLPCTHFELYFNESIQSAFSSKTNPIGKIFKAIHFLENVSRPIQDYLEHFKDGEIINQSFEEILNEIEKQVKA